MWTQLAIFYGIAAVIIGGFVSAMDKVNFNFRGRPLPYPRLMVGIMAGIIWPAVVWQMILPPRNR